jgi:nitroreductase
MDFTKLVQTRYSVRAYKPDPVPEELLQKVLDAARLAPTAASRQPFQLLVVHTANRQPELQRLYPRPWFSQAPLLIGICTLPEQAWVRASDQKNYAVVDAAIVMDHIILAATDAGLGTCWIAAFNPKVAREIFHIPPEAEPVAFTPMGYPNDTAQPKQRKRLEDLIRYEKWD